jgi:hypothetical protein
MSDDVKAHYRKVRKELAAMLGYSGDPDALPVDQGMRLDVIMGLSPNTLALLIVSSK